MIKQGKIKKPRKSLIQRLIIANLAVASAACLASVCTNCMSAKFKSTVDTLNKLSENNSEYTYLVEGQIDTLSKYAEICDAISAVGFGTTCASVGVCVPTVAYYDKDSTVLRKRKRNPKLDRNFDVSTSFDSCNV